MTEILMIKMPKATDDPEEVFGSPMEIAEHIGLTRGQKIATLEKWSFSVSARIDAISEGMPNQADGAYSRDVELYRQIEKALEKLRSSSGSPDA